MALTEQEEYELLSLEKEKAFESTPGGAAVGNPSIQGQSTKPRVSLGGERLATIGGAGAIGAGMGAVLPEILSGIGAAYPPAQPWTQPLSMVARNAGRLAGAVSGGVSGLASEAAGQFANASGAPPPVEFGARLVGGAVSPELIGGLWRIVKAIPSFDPKTIMLKATAKSIIEKLEKDPASINAQERELLDRMVAEIRGGPKTDQPAQTVFGALDDRATSTRAVAQSDAANILDAGRREASQALTGAQGEVRAIRAMSKAEADAAIAQAEKDAQGTIEATMKGPVATRRGALPRLQEIGENTLTAARSQRATLGADRTAADIGGDARVAVTTRNSAAIEAKNTADAALRDARDKLVAGREGTGQYIDAEPGYAALVRDLEKEVNSHSHIPDVAAGYKKVLDSITTKSQDATPEAFGAPMIGGKPAGPPTPVTFNRIDEARRALGKVFEGEPPTGYEALKGNINKAYYARLAKLQKDFAGGEGGAQDTLQKTYASNVENLKEFGTQVGKKFTAVDRLDIEKFRTDASTIPTSFFKSKQSVQDLVELTGDPAMVVKLGKEHAADQLRNASESEVRSWMTKNRDWLTTTNEGRQVWMEVSKYADALQKGERIYTSTQKGALLVKTSIGDKISDAERTAAGLRRMGESQATVALRTGDRSANDVMSAAESVVNRVLATAEKDANTRVAKGDSLASLLAGSKYTSGGVSLPSASVRDLVTSNNAERWAAASAAIHSSQQAKAAFPDAVRQIIADRAATNPRNLTAWFDTNIREAVTSTGLMSMKQVDEVVRQMAAVERMNIPQSEKFILRERMALQAIGGYVAGLVPRGLAALIPD